MKNDNINNNDINEQLICSPVLSDKLESFAKIDLNILKDNLLENIKVLEIELDNDFPKNIVVFQLIFCFELFLKYKLVIFADVVTLGDLKKYSHRIDDMVHDLVEKTSDQIYKDIESMIKKIKVDDQKIDFVNYVDFKYRFNKDGMLFLDTNVLKEKEKKIIKEVIECIKK